MKYEVIWNGKFRTFDDYDVAFNYAKAMTLGEEENDVALILTRSGKNVEIKYLRWIIFDMYELVELTI